MENPTIDNPFQAAMSPTYEEAIDERMTKFKGHHVMKQYMKDQTWF